MELLDVLAGTPVSFWQSHEASQLQTTTDSNLLLVSIDAEATTDKAALTALIAESVEYPYEAPQPERGFSWDGLVDVLRDVPEWRTVSGLVVVVHHCRSLWTRHYDLAAGLAESFTAASRIWQERHQLPLHLVFVDD